MQSNSCRVIITATLGKQDPLELIHYTNFDKNKDELVWKVARATTAAPGYFERFMIEEYGPLFDGGLTANNPTLTALSFIVNYYKVSKIYLKCKRIFKIYMNFFNRLIQLKSQ